MSLPKKDVRIWLSHDEHAALLVLCDTTEGLSPGLLAADVVKSFIRKRVHQASLVHTTLESSGSLKWFAEEGGEE